jgi:hypothetical protein
MSRLCNQTYTKGGTHTADGVKARVGIRAQRLVKRLAGKPCRLGNISHASGLGSDSKGMGKFGSISFLDNHRYICGNVLFGFQLPGKVKRRQIGTTVFFGHGLILQISGTVNPKNGSSITQRHREHREIKILKTKTKFSFWVNQKNIF